MAKSGSLRNELSGGTLFIMGDSISTFEGCVPPENAIFYEGERCEETGVLSVEDTWWGILAEKLGMRVGINGSYSGSKVCGDSFPFGASKARAAQLAQWFSRQDALGDACGEGDASAVIVFMGINDYGGGVEGGIKRFARDYKTLLENIKEACPGALILAATLLPGRVEGASVPTFCTQLRGTDICEFNDCIRAAARDSGCFCLDIAAFGFDYETIDGTHPNRRGMMQIALMMYAQIANRPACVQEDRALFPHELRSSRTCNLATCIGCPFAENTTEKWSCICHKLEDVQDEPVPLS